MQVKGRRVSGFKGKKHTEESKAKMKEAHKGKKLSNKQKQNISIGLKGYWGGCSKEERVIRLLPAFNNGAKKFWANASPEDKQERLDLLHKGGNEWWGSLSIGQKREHTQKAFKVAQISSPSSIETAIHKVLNDLNITYEADKQIGSYFPDIFIPCCNLVIECDGDYWHNLPGRQENDAQRDNFMGAHGYKVIRIWERDIRKDAQQALLCAINKGEIA